MCFRRCHKVCAYGAPNYVIFQTLSQCMFFWICHKLCQVLAFNICQICLRRCHNVCCYFKMLSTTMCFQTLSQSLFFRLCHKRCQVYVFRVCHKLLFVFRLCHTICWCCYMLSTTMCFFRRLSHTICFQTLSRTMSSGCCQTLPLILFYSDFVTKYGVGFICFCQALCLLFRLCHNACSCVQMLDKSCVCFSVVLILSQTMWSVVQILKQYLFVLEFAHLFFRFCHKVCCWFLMFVENYVCFKYVVTQHVFRFCHKLCFCLIVCHNLYVQILSHLMVLFSYVCQALYVFQPVAPTLVQNMLPQTMPRVCFHIWITQPFNKIQ